MLLLFLYGGMVMGELEFKAINKLIAEQQRTNELLEALLKKMEPSEKESIKSKPQRRSS